MGWGESNPTSRPNVIQDIESAVNQAQSQTSPIVLDIDASGTIELTELNETGSVYWDIDNDGFREASGWVTGGDGLLAIDLNSDGIINNHGELFGNTASYANGYLALDQYDTNNDDQITIADTDFGDFLIWVDDNADGYSQEDELHTLTDLNITSISTSFSNVSYSIAGNPIYQQSSFTMNGNSYTSVDAWFAFDNVNTRFDGDYTLDLRTLFLPTSRGYGEIPDMHIAASIDNDNQDANSLISLLTAFAALDFDDMFDETADRLGAVKDILFRWAGVDDVNPASRGAYVDARELEFLEKLLGQDFNQRDITTDPLFQAGEDIHAAFEIMLNNSYARLMAQGAGAELFEGDVAYDLAADSITGITGLNLTRLEDLTDEADLLTDPGEIKTFWTNVVRMIEFTVGTANLDSGDLTALEDALDLSGLVLGDLSYTDAVFGEDIVGTSGNDTLDGTALNEQIEGKDGDDTLNGGAGNDVLIGDDAIVYSGNDIMAGGAGADYVTGYSGDDTYVYNPGDGDDTYAEGYLATGLDRIKFGAGIEEEDLTFTRLGETDVLITIDTGVVTGSILLAYHLNRPNLGGSIELIEFDDTSILDLRDMAWTTTGTSGNDTINGVTGGSVLDIIDPGDGNDTVDAGVGDDIIKASKGVNQIHGGDGLDKLVFNGNFYGSNIILYRDSSALMTVYDTSGEDFGMERMYDDVEQVVFNDVTFDLTTMTFATNGAGVGTPIVINESYGNTGPGNDTVYAYPAGTIMYGRGGNDTFYGRAGDDILYGEAGSDTLYGGGGADRFAFLLASAYSDGHDILPDFSLGEGDAIDISDMTDDYNPWTDDLTDYMIISTFSGFVYVDATGSGNNLGVNEVAQITSDTNGLGNVQALVDGGNLIVKTGGWGNTGPVAQDDEIEGVGNAPITGNLLADNGNGADEDADDDIIGVRAVSLTTAAGANVVISTNGDFTYTPVTSFVGNDSFTYTLLDEYGKSDTATAYVTVLTPNVVPVAKDDAFAVITYSYADMPVTGNVLSNNGSGADSDSDGGNLSVVETTITTSQGRTVTMASNGAFTYVASREYVSTDTFDYTLSDGQGGTDTATVTITTPPPSNSSKQIGTTGNDTLSGSQWLFGLNGDDILTGTSSIDDVFGWNGNDTLYGGAGADHLWGGTGNDTIYGGDGNDQIYSGQGADFLHGGNGGDSYMFNEAGSAEGDVIEDNGDGTTSSGSISLSNLTANFSFNTAFTLANNQLDLIVATEFGTLTVKNQFASDASNRIGGLLWKIGAAGSLTTYNLTTVGLVFNQTGADDNINLSSLSGLSATAYRVYGNGGNDTLNFGMFAGWLHGGDGDDILSGDSSTSATSKTYYGDAGNDTITGSDYGTETLYGDDGNDYIDAKGGTNNYIYAGSGNDTVISGSSSDIIEGGLGTDNLSGGGDFDTYIFNSADELDGDIIEDNGSSTVSDGVTIYGLTAAPILRPAANGLDLLIIADGKTLTVKNQFSSDGNDKIDSLSWQSAAGNGSVHMGRAGAQPSSYTFTGTSGDDAIAMPTYGAATNITHYIYGLGGNDTLNGGLYSTQLFGGDGNDILTSGSGSSNVLHGDAGNDTLLIGNNTGTLYGDDGADIFKFLSATNQTRSIADFDLSEGDKIDLSALLTAYDPLTMAITDFVQITTSGANSLLKIDTNGGANSFVQIATITGVTGLTDEAALVTSGNLIVS